MSKLEDASCEMENASASNEPNSQPNNLLMFGAAISKCFQDISKCVSKEEFLQIFTMLESKPSVVKRLHKAMEEDLLNALNQDLEALITDECLVDGMKEIARLSEESTVPSNVQLWRPPGDVNLHLRSLDAEKIKIECKKLQSYIKDMEKENQDLMEKISKSRENVTLINDRTKQLLSAFKLSQLENITKTNQECVERLYESNT